MSVQPLDQNGHALAPGLNLRGGRGVGDAPVGPVVAADGGQARLAVEVLDAGLDPLAREGGGGLGEDEEDAGLVELVGVCGCECDGGGFELGEGVFGEGFVGGWMER